MNNDFFRIKDEFFQHLDNSTIKLLLSDKSTKKNIIWATDHYTAFGKGYQLEDEVTVSAIKGYKFELVKPRVTKSKAIQAKRVKNKAEVFTPSWVCNNQNNLIDNDWFGRRGVFNTETDRGWITNYEKIVIPEDRTWKEYVDSRRLEITCGEAPYIASLYDSVTGEYIQIQDRIGLLDRKLRIVNENASSDAEWIKWTKRAFQSIYAYEFQGDNLLLARENIFYTYIEHYRNRFNADPSIKDMRSIANIIAWNIWQMDGMKGVSPLSCKPAVNTRMIQMSLFPEYDELQLNTEVKECPGCRANGYCNHIGTYCKIQDWRRDNSILFINMIKGGKKL